LQVVVLYENPTPIGAIRSSVPDDPMTAAVHATVLLIRHAHTDAIAARLSGRLAAVHLTEAGRRQAAQLAQRLAPAPLRAVYSSPLERALETATPIAEAHGLEVLARDALTEVDYGAWTGKSFDALQQLPEWRRYNDARETAHVPEGESASAVQLRILRELERLWQRHCADTVAVISHADVIRAALLHYAGVSLNFFGRFTVDPASVSAVALDGRSGRVLYVNVGG
jgi:probable phosphoglycerate mutase